MNWYKTTLTIEQVNHLHDEFNALLKMIPRPQKSFLYELKDPIVTKGTGKEIFYDIYFSPDCIYEMKDLLQKYKAVACVKPIISDLDKLCGIEDYENKE